MISNLSLKYAEWREISEEMLKDGYQGSVDCGESVVREDFSSFAGLAEVISFDDMFALEREYESKSVFQSKFDELVNTTCVSYKGKELRTLIDPFVSDSGTEYIAHAIDVEGNEYMILWDVVNADTTDESEACNWENPKSIDRL